MRPLSGSSKQIGTLQNYGKLVTLQEFLTYQLRAIKEVASLSIFGKGISTSLFSSPQKISNNDHMMSASVGFLQRFCRNQWF